MTSIQKEIDLNQRLIVLRALAETNDGRMNETLLQRQLDHFGYALSREQVRDILRWLEERDAIATTMAGSVLKIAEITQRGQDHVERRGDPMEDVALPSRR